MNKNFNNLRTDFPIFNAPSNHQPLVYFDNASTAQKPQVVLDALLHFYTTINANIHRGIYTAGENATQAYENARKTVARFINAQPEEIIFTSGTTDSINFVASTWADAHLSEGDEIVLTELEHHANLIPWQQLAQKKGLTLRFIPVLSDGTLDLSSLDSLITSRTKLVSVIHVSNAVGTHVDVATIVRAAQSVGARVLVDAAQSVAHQKIDVTQLRCDFLAFSGHKLLGPTGIGVLFIKKELHGQTPPYRFGGGMVNEVTAYTATWAQAPHKFEAGTPPIAQALGLAGAIEYINKYICFDALREHEARLCEQLIEGLSRFAQIKIFGSVETLKKSGHIVSFVVSTTHSHDVAAFLNSRGISVRAGHHCAQPFAHTMGYHASVRVSFYFYNTEQEVECFLRVLRELF